MCAWLKLFTPHDFDTIVYYSFKGESREIQQEYVKITFYSKKGKKKKR